MNGRDVVIAPLELQKSTAQIQKSNMKIVLDKLTSSEFYDFGKVYYDEAKRILANMPVLPNKDSRRQSQKIQHKTQSLSLQQIQVGLANYLNDLIALSPLICNLFAFRKFMTDGSITFDKLVTQKSLDMEFNAEAKLDFLQLDLLKYQDVSYSHDISGLRY